MNRWHFFTILCASLASTACNRPPSGKAIFRAAFLRVSYDSETKPLSVAIAFPKCAHTGSFGSGDCQELLCNVVTANRTRVKKLEHAVCKQAEAELIPLLRQVNSERGCKEALILYAVQIAKDREIDIDEITGENGYIEPRLNFLPRSIRQSYGDSSAPSQELRYVWSL